MKTSPVKPMVRRTQIRQSHYQFKRWHATIQLNGVGANVAAAARKRWQASHHQSVTPGEARRAPLRARNSY
jgi:hypothetical protein